MQKGKAKQRAKTQGTQLICEDCKQWRQRAVHVQPSEGICHSSLPNLRWNVSVQGFFFARASDGFAQ